MKNAIIRLLDISVPATKIFLYVTDHSRVTRSQLQEELNLSRSSVFKALRMLSKHHYLTIHEEVNPQRNQDNTLVIKINPLLIQD